MRTRRQLISADFLIRRRRVGNSFYVFRHALFRDAAYECLLSGSRRDIHRRIAGALESFQATPPDSRVGLPR